MQHLKRLVLGLHAVRGTRSLTTLVLHSISTLYSYTYPVCCSPLQYFSHNVQAELDSQLLCKPVAYPELAHSEDRVAPELHKPACARGECEAEVHACYVREGAAAPPGTRTALRACNPHARTPSRAAAQDCLKAKLAKVRGCATEFAQSDELITCRLCKMPRTSSSPA